MKKDIFIDTNVIGNFSSQLDEGYKKLSLWLSNFNHNNPENNAYIVVSPKLISEYSRSLQHAKQNQTFVVILSKMQKEDRRVMISNQQIKDFQNVHFTKSIWKKLSSNKEDRDHIPVVLLSERKFALTEDENFTFDLRNFPKFKASVASRPQDLPFAE